MIRILILILLLGIASCSNSGSREPETSVVKNWVEYKEPGVFSIKHPEGWKVEFDKNSGRIKLSHRDDEDIYIWPVYSQGLLDEIKGGILLNKLVYKTAPGLSWNEPVINGTNSAVMHGFNKSETGTASLSWVSNQSNSAAICYVISAGKEYYKKDRDKFIGILSSFRPVISNSKQTPVSKRRTLQYVKWEDPNEHAFTVDVPKGWSVQGGLVRYSATDYRRGVNLISPDKEINVFLMDPGIPFFCLPSPTLVMSGFREGMYYTLSDGTRQFIRRYVTGLNFSYEYAIKRFLKVLNNLSVRERKNRRDIAIIDNREFRQLSASSGGMIRERSTAGDITFNGSRNGRQYSGYTEATTTEIASPEYGGGMWEVYQLYGFTAPESGIREAAGVMEKLVSSFMWNPQWYMMQNKITGNVSKIVAKTNDEMADIINQSFELGQKRQDKAMQEYSDYIRGTITLHDENGKEFNVWNTSNYYWINQFNDVAGTKLFENPDPLRFKRLLK